MKNTNMVKRGFFCVMCLIFLSLLANPVIAQETDLLTEKVIVIDEAIEGETPRLISYPTVAYDPNTVPYKPEIIDYDLGMSRDELLIEPKLLLIAPGEDSYGLSCEEEPGLLATETSDEENQDNLLIVRKPLPYETKEDPNVFFVEPNPTLISTATGTAIAIEENSDDLLIARKPLPYETKEDPNVFSVEPNPTLISTATGTVIEENQDDLLIAREQLPLETQEEDSELVTDTPPNLISPEPVDTDDNTLITPSPEPVSTEDEEPVNEKPKVIPRPIYPLPVITTSTLLISSALFSTDNPALISPAQVSTDTNSLPLLITSYNLKNRAYASKNLSDYANYNSPINFDSRWVNGYNEFGYLFNNYSSNNSNYSLPLWPGSSYDAYPAFSWPGYSSSNYNSFGWFNSYNGFDWFED